MAASTPNTPPASNAEPPRPMPFAIMRNAHEALRSSIRLQEQLLEAGERARFVAEWRDFQRALDVHMAMEDRAMFALLDSVSGGAITAANLPAEHVEDTRLARAVDAALAGADAGPLQQAWSEWKEDHLHHLAHEEEVMMPLTMKTGATPQERARVVHERLLTPSEAMPDFDWFIGWLVHKLSREGSSGQPANVATRVFAWGLQHACSRTQWQRLRPIVQAQCTPEIWAELERDFGLGGDGPIA